ATPRNKLPSSRASRAGTIKRTSWTDWLGYEWCGDERGAVCRKQAARLKKSEMKWRPHLAFRLFVPPCIADAHSTRCLAGVSTRTQIRGVCHIPGLRYFLATLS